MEPFVIVAVFLVVLWVLRPLGTLTADPKDMDSAEAMLREDYLPGVSQSIGESTPGLARLQRRAPEMVGGDKAIMLIESAPNEAVGGRDEDDDLPTPSHTSEEKGQLDIPSHYGSFSLTGKVIAASRRNPVVAINAIDTQMKGLKTSMKRFMNHSIYRDGSGLLGDCVSATDATGKTTIVVNAQLNHDGVHPFREGMQVAVLLKADGTTDDGVVSALVHSVSKTGHTITLDQVVSSAAGIDSTHGIYRHNSYNKVMYGFMAMLGSGNPGGGTDANGYYGAIDRTAAGNAFFKGNLVNNGGAAQVLTVDLVLQALQEAEREDGKVKAVYMRPDVWRAWGNVLWPSREWAGQIMTIDAGYRAFKYDGVPYVQDWDAPADRMLFVPEDNIRLLEMEPLGPLNPDGNILRQDGRKDVWIGDVVWRLQGECGKPNAGCILEDLAVRQIPSQS